MPEPSNGQATPAAAASTGQDPAGQAGSGGGLMAKLDDTKLQLANVVVALAALGVAIFAAVSACSANQLAANALSAQPYLAPGGLSASPGPSAYRVKLVMANAGGGDAQYVKAWLGTLYNLDGASFVGSCPQPIRAFSFFFPSGTVLGTTDTLTGHAKVPKNALPLRGTPTNSMVIYVSWQNNDGSTDTSCENLSNHRRFGNFVTRPG